jgi:hypothetical protein
VSLVGGGISLVGRGIALRVSAWGRRDERRERALRVRHAVLFHVGLKPRRRLADS